MKSRCLGTLVVVTAFALNAKGAAPRLEDRAGVLSAHERASIERQLTSAQRRLGSPVFIEVTSHLRGESAADRGERLLAARDEVGTDPVLLLLAVKDGAGAIATGKGNAGIVPELDAARIVRKLLASQKSQGWRVALASAIEGIVESAQATAERRRPLPPDPEDVPPPPAETEPVAPTPPGSALDAGDTAPGDTTENANIGALPDAGAPTAPGQARPPGGATPTNRSRLPLAIAAGILFLFALGLRRRKQLAASRQQDGQGPPPASPRTSPSATGHDPRLGPRGPRSPRR